MASIESIIFIMDWQWKSVTIATLINTIDDLILAGASPVHTKSNRDLVTTIGQIHRSGYNSDIH